MHLFQIFYRGERLINKAGLKTDDGLLGESLGLLGPRFVFKKVQDSRESDCYPGEMIC